MVFTVNGAARALMYKVSEALGSLVPVLAHNRRWGRAPRLYTRCHRGELSRERYALYVRFAIAIPSSSRRLSGTLSATAVSHRLMNTDATEPTLGLSPASIRRSMPRRNASAAAT